MAMDIRPASALRTEYNELATRSRMTGQPIYITRNGGVDLVVMDAQAFDEAMELRDLAYRREMRALEGIEQGRDEIRRGLGRPYRDAREEMDL